MGKLLGRWWKISVVAVDEWHAIRILGLHVNSNCTDMDKI